MSHKQNTSDHKNHMNKKKKKAILIVIHSCVLLFTLSNSLVCLAVHTV